MKTTLFAGCALGVIGVCSAAYAVDVKVGGNVEFTAGVGEMINHNEFPIFGNIIFSDYTGITGTADTVDDVDWVFKTAAEVNITTNTRTQMLEYGVYVNLDIDEDIHIPGILPIPGLTLVEGSFISDVDAHIRVRFSGGTLKFGTDIDGLQDAEDLDWVTVGPAEFSNEIAAPIFDHTFDHSVSDDPVILTSDKFAESSITFTSDSFSGFSVAGEITPDADGDLDWGASLMFNGYTSLGGDLRAVIATDSSEAILANAKMSFGDLIVGGMYGKDDDDEEYAGGALAYEMGALAVSGGFLRKDAETGVVGEWAKQEDIILGVEYDLAPGLTIGGSAVHMKRIVNDAPDQVLKAESYVGRIKLRF